MRIARWRAVFLLVVRPSALKKVAAEYHEYINRRETMEAKLQREKDSPPHYEQSIDRIRRGLFTSLGLVAMAFALAALTGRAIVGLNGPVSEDLLESLQYIGIGILLWATLAKQGWAIQTFDGTTVPEVVDEFLYRALYVLGSFVLALSVTMQLAA